MYFSPEFQVMKALKDIKYTGVLRPDHVPLMSGEQPYFNCNRSHMTHTQHQHTAPTHSTRSQRSTTTQLRFDNSTVAALVALFVCGVAIDGNSVRFGACVVWRGGKLREDNKTENQIEDNKIEDNKYN